MTDEAIRIATWNMKQAVAPRKPLPELWQWLESVVDPHVVVLTEARVPRDGLPAGWAGVWRIGGIGPKRSWGTVIAVRRGVELVDVDRVTDSYGARPIDELWPGTVRAADVHVDSRYWATVVGIYALTVDREGRSCGHGRHSTWRTMRHLRPLFRSRRGERMIVAGDFNVLPADLTVAGLDQIGLVDLTKHTSTGREPLAGCSGCDDVRTCGHMWTHRNGGGPNAATQQLDHVFASAAIAADTSRVYGGITDFPDAWDMSDHAPVVVESILRPTDQVTQATSNGARS